VCVRLYGGDARWKMRKGENDKVNLSLCLSLRSARVTCKIGLFCRYFAVSPILSPILQVTRSPSL